VWPLDNWNGTKPLSNASRLFRNTYMLPLTDRVLFLQRVDRDPMGLFYLWRLVLNVETIGREYHESCGHVVSSRGT
jgi:hypothetical protein